MNRTKQMWEEVKKRNNTITTGFDYDTGHDETYGVELSDVMDPEEIQAIDQMMKDYEDLQSRVNQLSKEITIKQKEEANSQGSYISEAKYYVTGRGNIYIIDMNDYPDKTITVGDVITIDGMIGIVRGLEITRNLFGEVSRNIGVQFREVQPV